MGVRGSFSGGEVRGGFYKYKIKKKVFNLLHVLKAWYILTVFVSWDQAVLDLDRAVNRE